MPLRLDSETLSFIEMLVKLGIYSSRSEALRELIRLGAEELKWVVKVAEAAEKLFELERENGEIPVKLNGALKQLLKERSQVLKMSYVDTSIIVAALDTKDPRWKMARRVLEREEYKVVSELAIAELVSVVSRREELLEDIASKLGLTRETTLIARIHALEDLRKLNKNRVKAIQSPSK